MEYQTLNNGLKIPTIGFGVFRVPDKKECEESVHVPVYTRTNSASLPAEPEKRIIFPAGTFPPLSVPPVPVRSMHKGSHKASRPGSDS